jgi:hypothetical protein
MKKNNQIPYDMEAEQIFKEIMKSDKLQTLNISEEEAQNASYVGISDNAMIEVIKDVIKGVANRKSVNSVYQGILKKVSE